MKPAGGKIQRGASSGRAFSNPHINEVVCEPIIPGFRFLLFLKLLRVLCTYHRIA